MYTYTLHVHALWESDHGDWWVRVRLSLPGMSECDVCGSCCYVVAMLLLFVTTSLYSKQMQYK